MALLDLVEFLDPVGNVLAARVPEHGSGELRLGSQCIVRDTQVAVFCRDGRMLDLLTPGRHTLSTNNLPLLADLLALPFGSRSPFRADVYYVGLHQHTDLRWGTPQPILARDPQLGVVRLRAFGSYVVQVADPRTLLAQLVGTRGRYTVQDAEEHLRGVIVGRVADAITARMRERQLSVLDLASEYDELAAATAQALADDMAALGLKLVRFYISTISVPEDVEQTLDRVGSVSALGGLDAYTRVAAADALRAASTTPNAAGAGLGLGAGLGMGQLLGQSLLGTPPATGTCPHCQMPTPANARFCSECGGKLHP